MDILNVKENILFFVSLQPTVYKTSLFKNQNTQFYTSPHICYSLSTKLKVIVCVKENERDGGTKS